MRLLACARSTCAILISILVLCLSACATSSNNRPMDHNMDLLLIDSSELAAAKSAYVSGDDRMLFAVDALLRRADRALSTKPLSVTTKSRTPDSGDKRDYMSIGPYWWPDETKPDGLPWVRRDGDRNPAVEGPNTNKRSLNAISRAISILSLAYYYTEDAKYAEHADTLIRTWFVTPETRMNPNFYYAQAIPGRASGREFGVIESRFLIRFLDDMTLLRNGDAFSDATYTGFKGWLSSYLDWLLTSEPGKRACDLHNNHGTYCEAQVASYAWYLGRLDVAKKYVERATYDRLTKQITPLGEQPDELARTRPWHYSLFNLEAYFTLARVADHIGLDSWTYEAENGASIRKAFDYVVSLVDTGKNNWHGRTIKQTVRSARLFWFLQTAARAYDDPRYLEKTARIPKLAAKENRSEFVQCLLIAPYSQAITLDDLEKADPKGNKSLYRCYY